MRKLFTNRWFLGAIGLLAIALLVWFVGPGIAIFSLHPLESALARGILILLFALGWTGYEVLRIFWAKRANEKLLESIAATPEGAAASEASARSAEEVATLKRRFEEAAAVLKKARFKDKGGGQQYLYQLPWYAFIGAPGSGKTTALVNCGLRFPLAEGGGVQAVQGVGGTRNCDWWFTEDAVFLDTAGRYTTQESDGKVDSAAWLGFLDLIRKFRPRRPLNGVIVTISISDLLTQNEADRMRYAASIRQRVQELYDRLGVKFPIYLMVTKTDLLAGFNEFFGDMGREERSQVWGMTFPFQRSGSEATDYSKAFSAQFGVLESRLNARLTDRLQAERDAQRRALIYNFPQQFSVIGPMVALVIDYAFRASRFDQQAMLRGVYFTSGTQEGTPIDRVLGTLARSFNLERKLLPPSAASGKSYFLTRLLQEVVFPEAGLAGLNEKRERIVRWVVRGAYTAVALVAVGLVAGMAVSFANNRALVSDVSRQVDALADRAGKLPPPRAGDIAAILPVLNELRGLPYGYAESERGAGLGMRFGMFQGHKLGQGEKDAYRGVLRDAFLPRFAMRLEEQMRNPPNSEVLYEALKNYLMLFDDKHADPQALEDWMVADWGRTLPKEAADGLSRQALAGHLKASLERRPVAIRYQRDDDLVASARRTLATASRPDCVYSRIRLIGVDGTVPPFKVSEAAGPAASQVLARRSGKPLSDPFPALYTYDGYQKAFRPQVDKVAAQMATEESWVLGEQSSTTARISLGPSELVEEVRRRYLEDYVREWDALLADIQLRASSSMSDTILFARVLASPESPLKKLAVAVAKETSLAPREDVTKALTEKAAEAVSDVTKKAVSKLLGGAAPPPAAGKAPESRVDDHFEPLRKLTTAAAPGGPMPLDQILTLLNDFYQELSAAESAMRASGALVPSLPTAAKLRAEADRMPAPVSNLVLALIGATSGQTAAAAQENLKKAIGGVGGAASFCGKAIEGRYPVSKKGKADISVEDFGAVFAPGGELAQFFEKNLQALVDTSGREWRARPGTEKTIPVPAAAIRQFQNADVIRRTFFRSGAQPAATADLVLLSTDVGPVTLEYDGETFKFGAGQAAAARLKWPSQKPAPVAKLYLSPTGQSATGDGAWALFRLFDQAEVVDGTTPERRKLTFTVDGRKVVFELRPTSVFNPFFLKELESFRCPG